MPKAPGYEKWPNHRIVETPIGQSVLVEIAGHGIAASRNVIRLDEDKHPVRYYFPRSDVRMDCLERSATTTRCPFKGTASYYHAVIGGRRYEDAVWSYEDPYDEHRDLKGRLAFYDDRIPEMRIRVAEV